MRKVVQPLKLSELKPFMVDGRFQGVVELPLITVISFNVDELNDYVDSRILAKVWCEEVESNLPVAALQDISYRIVGHNTEDNTVLLQVTADIYEI